MTTQPWPGQEPEGPLGDKAFWVVSVGFAGLQMVDWPVVPVADTGVLYLVATLAGTVIGGLWQALGRRDLANRLVYPAILTLVGSLMFLDDSGEYTPASIHAMLGLVIGLVLAEQGLRIRDRRAARERELAALLAGEGEQD